MMLSATLAVTKFLLVHIIDVAMNWSLDNGSHTRTHQNRRGPRDQGVQ